MKFANFENLSEMYCAGIVEDNYDRWNLYFQIAYAAMVGMAACQIGEAPVRIIVDDPEELDGTEEVMVALVAPEDFDWSSIGGDPDPGGDSEAAPRSVTACIAERAAVVRIAELFRKVGDLRVADVSRRLDLIAAASSDPHAIMDAGTIATVERILNDIDIRAAADRINYYNGLEVTAILRVVRKFLESRSQSDNSNETPPEIDGDADATKTV